MEKRFDNVDENSLAKKNERRRYSWRGWKFLKKLKRHFADQ
jgi:hypothetical protein